MARKSSASTKGQAKAPKPSAPPPADGRSEPARIADAALSEIAAMGWRDTSLDGVAARAGLDVGRVRLWAPIKSYLPPLIIDAIDEDSLGRGLKPDPTSSPRDRLFDVVMRRFDALQRRRAGIVALIKGLLRDPAAAATAALRFDRSAAATLATAGISPNGLKGCTRQLGLKAIMAATLRAWFQDESADMAKTMAALDRALNAAERLVALIQRRGAAAAKPGS